MDARKLQFQSEQKTFVFVCYQDNLRLLFLVQIILALLISSANCERAFSAQKRIKSDVRSSLTRLSDLIFI